MTIPEKKGALLFFGKAGCVSCHAVSGQSNEMFSDFKMHVAGVPQIAPNFGWGQGRLEDAIRFHLDAAANACIYNSAAAGIARDLRSRIAPSELVLVRLDPLLVDRQFLSPDEFESLVAFVKYGLRDARAQKESLCRLLPANVPSDMPAMHFGGCPNRE
jgi:cytochrome c peroxidase